MNVKSALLFGFLVLIFLSVFVGFSLFNFQSESNITNFEECIAAGNPAMESYPRQCIDPISDKLFVEVINDSWRLDSIELRQHETDLFYGCFGCGATLCVDPIPEMKFVEETEERYCSENFEVIEK